MINDLISIFKSSATRKQLIETNGEYILNEICSYAKITEGLNDEFILEAEFEILAPVKKEIYDLLTHENILKVPDEYGDEFFTIFDIYKTADYIKVIARQITIAETLDLFLEDVRPKETNGAGAITHIFANTTQKHELTVSSDITDISTAYYNCKNVYEALHDCDMSFQNRWGGEVYRRQFNLHINKKVGSYRGVKIKSNKNLTGFEENTNKDSVCTRIYPKGFNGITIEEKFVDSPNIGMYKRPIPRVVTFEDVKVRDENTNEDEDVFETLEQAQEELKKRCNDLFEIDKVDFIKGYYTINHEELRKTEEYKNYSATEMTCIGDEVDVEEEILGIEIRTRVVKRVFDVLAQERIETELSNVGIKRVITLPDIEKELEKIPSVDSFLDQAKDIATSLINAGIKNSHVVVRKNEILIMDTSDINTAQKVWRFNVNGLGYSSTGYHGQYGLAITMDGSIVADFINVGILNANLIKTGIIQSLNGNIQLNVDSDYLEVNHSESSTKTRLDAEGMYILDSNGETIASLASKESWTELRANKVRAEDIENIYIKNANIYIDHAYTGESDGTLEKPLKNFAELLSHFAYAKIINQAITINVLSTGDVYDSFKLYSFYGTGRIDINFNKNLTLRYNENHVLDFRNLGLTVRLNCGNTGKSNNDGVVFDASGTALDTMYHAMFFDNCEKIVIYDGCRARAAKNANNNNNSSICADNSFVYVNYIDTCDSSTSFQALNGGMIYVVDSRGNPIHKVCHIEKGGDVQLGINSETHLKPFGSNVIKAGRYVEYGTLTSSSSFYTYPEKPPTQDQYKEFTFNNYGYWSELYNNWNPNGKTVYQGSYGYGNNRGIFTLPNNAINSFLVNATVLDGSTITLQRENAGGYSSAQTIYLCGTTHTSASGSAPPVTKSYGSIGSLAWGEKKTFNLPKAFVQDLKAGTIKSVMFYTSNGSNYIKFSAVCTLRLKVNK